MAPTRQKLSIVDHHEHVLVLRLGLDVLHHLASRIPDERPWFHRAADGTLCIVAVFDGSFWECCWRIPQRLSNSRLWRPTRPKNNGCVLPGDFGVLPLGCGPCGK